MKATTAPIVLIILVLSLSLSFGPTPSNAFHCSVQLTSDVLGFVRGPAFFTNTTDSFTLRRSGLSTTSPIVITSASQVLSFMVMFFSPEGSEALALKADFTSNTALTAILDGYEFPVDFFSTSSSPTSQWFPLCCSPTPSPLPVSPKVAWMASTVVTAFRNGVDFRATNGLLSFLINCNTA